MLELELKFILAQLDEPHVRTYRLSAARSRQVRAWTDASFSPGNTPSMRLCTIVVSESGRAGVVCDVPASFFGQVAARSTYIAFGELFAVCLIFRFFAADVRGASLVIFVDNIGVIHMLVNGVSKDLELGAIVSATNFRIAQLDSLNWWEYVASASNIADGGSRVGVGCAIDAALRIPLREILFHSLPSGFPRVPPFAWDAWWEP